MRERLLTFDYNTRLLTLDSTRNYHVCRLHSTSHLDRLACQLPLLLRRRALLGPSGRGRANAYRGTRRRTRLATHQFYARNWHEA